MRAKTFCSSNSAARGSSAERGPESVTDFGELTAEIVMVRSWRAAARGGVFGGEADGQHGAFAAGALLHEAGAEGDESGGGVEIEDAGEVSGGDFADAVADDGGGFHAPRTPEFGEGDVHREEGGLGDLGALDLGGVFVAGELGEKGEIGVRIEGAGGAFDRGAEGRLVAP